MREMTLEEIRQTELGILKYTANFCDKHGLKYFLAYGTLLGAVRHKGFIPWDDDVDIIMRRDDYKKLCQIFNNYNSDYELLCLENTENYYVAFAKIVDKRTILQEGMKNPLAMGVYIDIFVSDNLSNDYKLACKLVNKIQNRYKLIVAQNIADRKGRGWYKQLIVRVAQLLLGSIDRYKMLVKIDAIAQTYSDIKESKYCGAITDASFTTKQIMERAWFKDVVKLKFEDCEFYVPKEYNKVLTALYGDYMTPPPVEQQVTHHCFKAHWKD